MSTRFRSTGRIALLLALLLVLALPQIAAAADTTEIVNPADLSTTIGATDWHIAYTAGTPTHAIVSGPATPPLGSGSLQMATGAAVDKRYIFNYDHANQPLSAITHLGYSTYGNSGTLAVVLQVQIDPDGAGPGVPRLGGGSPVNFATVSFEPYHANTVTPNTWQTWNALSDGASIWASNVAGDTGNSNNGTQANPATWAEFIAFYPAAVISGGFGVNVGSGWSTPFTGSVDALKIGYAGDTFTYDFDPATPCTTICYADAVNGNDLNGGASAADAKKTIQAAVNAVQTGGQVIAADGVYAENVVIPKSLTLTGSGQTNDANGTVLEGNNTLTGSGILVNTGITNVTIENLRAQNYSLSAAAGVYANGQNNNFTVQNVTSVNNGIAGNNGGGVYMNGPVDNVLIDHVTATGNRSRGIVIWNGFKTDITITNNTVTGNNCCGIELQDGTASGVTVTGNTVSGNVDSGMAFIGLMAGEGPNLIANNTLTDNGRFGIEIKLPNGTGLPTGDGSIVIEDNNISMTAPIADGVNHRDGAGISAYRRGWVAGNNNVDIPTGVIIRDNNVSGYQQTSTSEGFGIVVEGLNMTVTGNTLTNNEVGAQVQGGHTPYVANTAQDGDQNNVADQFFGRGNSPVGCALISGNTFSGNTADAREVGTGGMVVAKNVQTGETFCTIQAAIDDADTLAGHTIEVYPGTHAENVTVNKKITLDGAGSGSNPLVDTIIDPVTGRGLMITASGASAADRLVIKDLRVTGAPDDGITLEGTNGGSYLTLDNVASVGQTGAGSDGIEIKHLNLITDVKIVDSDLSGNGLSGFRMGTGTKLDGLTVENTTFDGNQYGLNVYAANPAPTFDHITFTNVAFTNNTQKGIYTERLNNATFTGLTVTGNGSTAGSFLAGIDINLKYANFSNISITDSTFSDNGLADNANSGVDLTVKARNDGSYAVSPATLTNLTISKVIFSGAADGSLSLGNNLDEATTAVNRNAFIGTSGVGAVVFGTAPAAMLNLTCNWWNAASGPSGAGPGSGAAVSANADFTPWLYTNDLDGPCFVGGTITVVKQTTPDGDPTDFEFDPSWGANFTLSDGQSETSAPLQANNYSVAEVNLAAPWTQQSASCDNAATPATETVNPSSIPVADGDAWTCTFQNVRPLCTTVCYVDTVNGSDVANGGATAGDAFKTIQHAVNTVQVNGEVRVLPGTYPEQVTISKSLTIFGTAGKANTFIKAPATLPIASDPNSVIVKITGAGVEVDISEFTVSGPGPSGCGSIGYGIFVRDGAYANIHDNKVVDIRDTGLSGCQNGIGILVGRASLSTSGTADIKDNEFSGYQKLGLVVSNTGSSANVEGNTFTGDGPINYIAENGIQVSGGATAEIIDNTITGHSYTPATYASAGMLLYGPGEINTDGNTVTNNQVGIWLIEAPGTHQNNTVSATATGTGSPYHYGMIVDAPPPGRVPAPLDDAAAGPAANGPAPNAPLQTVVVTGNTFTSDNSAGGVGLEADAGYGASDIDLTATKNIIHNWDTGVAVFECIGGGCSAGTFTNVDINRNSIAGNTDGMFADTVDPAETDGTCNWWGNASGPSDAGPGTGDSVSTEVDFTPWLYTNDLDGPCYVGGTISIDKVAPGGGATQFTFDVSWSANHVMLTDAAAPYVTTPPLPAGPYTITEINNPTGWSQQSATCDNAVTPAPETVNPSAITVADGDAWLCTFTNSYTPPPANTCPVGAASNQWTDLLGIGMGSPKKHKASAKLTIPNATNLVDLYGQLVAKNNGAAKYVRFIMKGKNNYVEVNTVTGPAEQLGGTFWYGADLPTANTTYVTGKWFLQKGGTKNHIPRAFLLYPTYNDPAHTYVNTWDTFTPAEGEVDWNVAAGWTPYREIIVPITAPLGPETFHVELALVDNDKDTRPVWVTVTAGGVSQTVQPTGPSNGDTLNLLVFDLVNVPAGTDEIVIEVYSPSMALDGIIGDSAALVGMTANYQCSPLSN